jgi:hypothetical protein
MMLLMVSIPLAAAMLTGGLYYWRKSQANANAKILDSDLSVLVKI